MVISCIKCNNLQFVEYLCLKSSKYNTSINMDFNNDDDNMNKKKKKK